ARRDATRQGRLRRLLAVCLSPSTEVSMTTFSSNDSVRRVRAPVFAAATLALAAGACVAASHREGPAIANAPKVDATDLFMFRSYEPGREGYVTILADYIPFQDPQGGPNFYTFDDKALYEIHVDNNGDGQEDITFQFRFKNASKSTTLSVGGKSVRIPL